MVFLFFAQLQEQLVQKEKELLEKEVEVELKEEETYAQQWERSTSVLEEVLAAQKDRDQALMSRLLLANEERDEALLCARRLQRAAELDDVNLQDADTEIDELLQSVCEASDVQEVQRFGTLLIRRLRTVQQRRNDITAQEMKAVMEDRDKSVARNKRLEEDLLQQKHLRMAQEDVLQRHRDGALEDQRELQAERQELQVDDSPNGPPSLPSDAVPQKTPTSRDQNLQVQLQQLSREKQSVEEQLRRSQEAERDAAKKVLRLERLVEVLRKKVGTGSLRVL
uniref:Mirror-image polydactyly 1 n=1 Tax=Kryptolebias marmoratus TaxID=37003 RepID=A0A3Q3A2B7_KRYMA